MSFEVLATEPFAKQLKKLASKHRSLKSDLLSAIEELEENPKLGTPLGKNCYKIRLAISSKNQGKAGGARIITYVRFIEKTVYLLSIYDKSQKDAISQKELLALINLLNDLEDEK